LKNNYNVVEVIQMAINIEKEGYEFYSRIAKHAATETSKAVFVLLAEQEKKHIDTFTNLLNIMSGIHSEQGQYMFDEEVSSYFLSLTENTVFKASKMYEAADMTSAKEAIHAGIHSEKNSVLFYMELLKTTELTEVRDSLELIIEEEKRHIRDLNTLLKTL
jgi:rubrerythrin